VGLFRRYFPSTRAVKQLLDRQALGGVTGFQFLEGDKYAWPAQTTSMFSRELAGGGVLIDAGAHLADLLLWWLGDFAGVDYSDDAMGGVEANCELKLRLQSGVEGRVRLSREHPLPNEYIIHCERGDIVYRCDHVDRLYIRTKEDNETREIDLRSETELKNNEITLPPGKNYFDFPGCFAAQLADFCRAAAGTAPPPVSAAEARKSVALIQECYRSRRFLKMPWLAEAEQEEAEAISAGRAASAPAGPQVAVIGAGGFIGYRLCEWLLLNNLAAVTPVIRSAKSLALLARFKLKPEFADVLDRESLAKAFAGKDIIFHAAVGDRRTIVDGIRNTLQAAKAAGVRRVVYLSTGCVYGNAPPPGTDETSPLAEGQPFAYNSAKVAAEAAIKKMSRELNMDTVIIRPLIVWGPRSQGWVADQVRHFREGNAYLIAGGGGICNAVYIDNLVSALWLAATSPEAKNEDFIINDPEPITWHDYCSGLAGELGMEPSPWQEIAWADAEPELEKIARRERAQRRKNLPVRLAGKIVPQDWKPFLVKLLRLSPPAGNHASGQGIVLDAETVALQRGSYHLSADKAGRRLGYQPPVSFAEGMARTGRWLRFVSGGEANKTNHHPGGNP